MTTEPSTPNPGESPVDLDRIEAAVKEILAAVGEDPQRDGLLDTPGRVARMYAEVFRGLHEDPKEHLARQFDVEHNEMVIIRDIAFYSMCEHHLLPFHGTANVGYIPGPSGKVVGLSKLARVVEGYAARPQVQERLTSQIADAIMSEISALGAIVVMEAEHMCMSMRGVRSPRSATVTSAVRGQLKKEATRAEAMSLITSQVSR
ncbi:GTP cyclohydrolase I FolE [Helcobacillus massiliensis]|uniref:GTP cyclohydrolase 1 n=1 Tax=Helcobacillus massiliensis TaxID=521392 RepID=A0A839QRL1_9MICO|nr:GTP cyclohydrolase I FolE [Helcobacillus massiliensis]MCG7426404.1 GTP cyclohydrolase I FolE [Helcobacillus sp. ACRRO]MBB3022662.1 GTP cyclohydrolase I [Helcobacillus massiliensis]MCT1558255.1 GTP cyclohydrolase I FolE [Helcobacillus massiliensis]MCT2035506.1 GTP cyclohydrolase I FolE [Helcobacillus massiliensis]MCT2331999.1 GTP cyclohydrolase I FolE [Helcobacillus massiliensis]